MELQQIISRKGDPRIPSVLSFGFFEGLGATNVIPSDVKIKGTFRTFNEEWRSQAQKWITDYVHAICESAGATVDLRIEKGYPFLKNDTETVTTFLKKMDLLKDEIQLKELDVRMTSEDFSYYSQEVPTCFFRLGVSNNSIETHFGVHHPQFLIDEKALGVGVKSFCINVLDI